MPDAFFAESDLGLLRLPMSLLWVSMQAWMCKTTDSESVRSVVFSCGLLSDLSNSLFGSYFRKTMVVNTCCAVWLQLMSVSVKEKLCQ